MSEVIEKQILDAVKKELKIRLDKEVSDYDEISSETAISIIEDEGLPVYTDFKDKLISAWAIARYIQLSLEEKELIELVKKDLSKIIPENVSIAFIKKFSCEVQLTKDFVEGEKKQALTLKYFLDKDDEVQYKISSGIWGWDISKIQIQALLNNKSFVMEKFDGHNFKQNKNGWFKNFIKKVFHVN